MSYRRPQIGAVSAHSQSIPPLVHLPSSHTHASPPKKDDLNVRLVKDGDDPFSESFSSQADGSSASAPGSAASSARRKKNGAGEIEMRPMSGRRTAVDKRAAYNTLDPELGASGDVHEDLVEEDLSDEKNPFETARSVEGELHEPTHVDEAPVEWPSVLAEGWNVYIRKSMHAVFLSTWMNWLLLAIPFAIISSAAGWGDGPTFMLSLIALCPLAERISFVTDELCKYTNPTLGGLISATMGNMTELIVSLVALRNGLLVVVQLSLIGSIVSNLLLVMGTAFLLGGFKQVTQKYSVAAAATNCGLLLLSVMGLLFPMVLIHSNDDSSNSDQGELRLSRVTSLFLLFVYGALVYYQLKTHRHLFEAQEEEEEEDEPPVLGLWGAIFWAGVVTLFISVLSEFIVDAIEGAARQMGMPILFISTILLPIVGNAAEHASAIIFAMRNKMDVALGIAVGSATQISLFVIPFNVLVGWWIGQPLSLDFRPFETVVLFITVVIVSMSLQNGTSDWLKGVLLLVCYCIISASFWIAATPVELLKESRS